MIGVFLEGNLQSLGAGNRMAGIRVCNDTDSRNASFCTHQLIRCLSWHYRRAAGAGTGGGGLVLVSSAVGVSAGASDGSATGAGAGAGAGVGDRDGACWC